MLGVWETNRKLHFGMKFPELKVHILDIVEFNLVTHFHFKISQTKRKGVEVYQITLNSKRWRTFDACFVIFW